MIGYCEGMINNQITTTYTYTYDVLGSLKEHVIGGIIGNVLPTQCVEKTLRYLVQYSVLIYSTRPDLFPFGNCKIMSARAPGRD